MSSQTASSSSFHSWVLTKSIQSVKTWCFREETDCSTSSAVFFRYLKNVPGSCQAGRCQAYARVFHACADRFVYIITYFKNCLFTLLDMITRVQCLPVSSPHTIIPWKTWRLSCCVGSEFDLHWNRRQIYTKKEGVIKSLQYKYLNEQHSAAADTSIFKARKPADISVPF